MDELGVGIIATVVGGLIVYLVKRFIENPLRDWVSIKKKQQSIDGDNIVEEVSIRNQGPFSYGGGPIYFHNDGEIHNLVVSPDQRNAVDIILRDQSNAIILPKGSINIINLQATVSGTTTASGSLTVIKNIEDKN